VEAAFLSARRQAVDLAAASPERALARTRTPVLLIHPVDDHNIPVRHSRRLKQVHPEVTLWEVPRGGHTGALAAFPEEYEQRVIAWFSVPKR
jgi:predicted alpha/beta-fold hydrolase